MEIQQILTYIKDFGIVPVLLATFIFYLIKKKDEIFRRIADQISLFLQDDKRKFLEQADNDLLIKDIQILELFLLEQGHKSLERTLKVYDKYKDQLSEHMDDFKSELEKNFNKSSLGDGMEFYSIRPEIIQYFLQDVREKEFKSFISQLNEAVLLNGNSNQKMFKKLLQDMYSNLVRNTTDLMEKKFLYSKL
ncbi:MAG: hypothetical protein IEMM0008_0665 [bacterium]|nr:MAG: hypothetical protein IEMM0008_0665 [bacterium]